MDNIVSVNSFLQCAKFDFGFTDKYPTQLEVSDVILIRSVKEKKIILNITRTVRASNLQKDIATVGFEIKIDTFENQTIDSVEKSLKENNPIYGNVFPKISLVISQNTAQCILGPIITAPVFNPKYCEIKHN